MVTCGGKHLGGAGKEGLTFSLYLSVLLGKDCIYHFIIKLDKVHFGIETLYILSLNYLIFPFSLSLKN